MIQPEQERLAYVTSQLAAEGMRHIWDTPEEDEAWAYLQELSKGLG